MMKTVLWILCIVSVVGIFTANIIHEFLLGIPYYPVENATLIQVVFSVAAGILATKAADSSQEIKALLKIDKIDDLLGEAQSAEEKAFSQKEKLRQIEKLLTAETEAEFARDMIVRHRDQLEYHWREIIKLEIFLDVGPESENDAELRNRVRAYLVKTRYIDYMGRGLLRNIPIVGSMLHTLFGPIWDEYYYRNMQKINKRFRATATHESNRSS